MPGLLNSIPSESANSKANNSRSLDSFGGRVRLYSTRAGLATASGCSKSPFFFTPPAIAGRRISHDRTSCACVGSKVSSKSDTTSTVGWASALTSKPKPASAAIANLPRHELKFIKVGPFPAAQIQFEISRGISPNCQSGCSNSNGLIRAGRTRGGNYPGARRWQRGPRGAGTERIP